MKRLRVLVVVGALSVAAVVASVQAAGAAQEAYCSNVTLAGGAHCDGPRHTMWMNEVYRSAGSTSVCAGQLDASGNWFGAYACHAQSVIKCYSGTNLLYPRMHNGEVAQYSNFYGIQGWGTIGTCPP